MGFCFDGYRRLTFQFNDGWKGEDEYQYLGQFMILKSRLRHSNDQDSSNGEAGERIYTVRVPRGISRSDIINALRDAFTTGCRCEHDCLWSSAKPMPTGLDAKGVERGLLRFVVTTTSK